MRRNTFRLLTLSFMMLCAAAPMRAQAHVGGNFGLGVVAGDPAGVSGKIWMGQANALDFIVGFSVLNDWIRMNADYVWNDFSLIRVPKGELPVYYGMGLWTAVAKHSPGVGARGVVGLEYLFPSAPLDVFLELGPGAAIIPDTEFDLSGGLGMRFYF